MTVDEQNLRQYLLGALSAADAEWCEEQSIVDDNFAAQLEAVENDLLDAYLQGELPKKDRAQFEEYYLASPLRREKLQFARTFQKIAATETTKLSEFAAQSVGLTQEIRARPQAEKRNWFASVGFNLQWGLATAAILLLGLSGWFFWQSLQLRQQANQAQTELVALQKREQELQTQIKQQQESSTQAAQELAKVREQLAALEQQKNSASQQAKSELPSELSGKPNIVNFSLAPQTRSIGQVPTLLLPTNATATFFNLQLEPNDFASYKITLRDNGGNKVIWQSGIRKAKGDASEKHLFFIVPANIFKVQSYSFAVAGIAADGVVEDIGSYSFRVNRP